MVHERLMTFVFYKMAFIEFLSYTELNSEECQNSLWLTVGAYKISEQFIRNNLDKINITFM